MLAATRERAAARSSSAASADGRPFVNVASAGLASVAARRAAPLKPKLGPLAYAVGALRAAGAEHPLRCTIRADGARSSRARPGRRSSPSPARSAAAPRSAPPTPRTACSTSPCCPRARASALARRAWGLRRGTIAEQRDVCHARGHVIEVDLPPGTEFNADGELLDDGMERITVEHDAFRLVVG